MARLKLKLLLLLLPVVQRKKGPAALFRLAAAAFATEPPALRSRSRDERLRDFAVFTRSQAERALARGETAAVREELFAHCERLGREIRSRLPIRGRADAAAALRAVYKLLAIDIQADAGGEVTVRRCFFADHYTPDACRFMAAMDEGIVAGLCGGRLVFSQRITEGAACCRARIEWPEGKR